MTAVTVRKEDRALNPEIATLYQFHAQKALFKIPKICNINFLIENDSHPLEVSRKLIRFGRPILPSTRPLLLKEGISQSNQ